MLLTLVLNAMVSGVWAGEFAPGPRKLPVSVRNPKAGNTSKPSGSAGLLNVAVVPFCVFENCVAVPTASDSKVNTESACTTPTATMRRPKIIISLPIQIALIFPPSLLPSPQHQLQLWFLIYCPLECATRRLRHSLYGKESR